MDAPLTNSFKAGDRARLRSKDSVLSEHGLKPGDGCAVLDVGAYYTVIAENSDGEPVELRVACDELMPFSVHFPPDEEEKNLRSSLSPQKLSF